MEASHRSLLAECESGQIPIRIIPKVSGWRRSTLLCIIALNEDEPRQSFHKLQP
jgi:hypothetical protein